MGPVADLVRSLQQITAGIDPALQWLVVMLAGAIPFVESYYGSVVGVVAGVPAWLAIPAAILGNLASTTACVHLAAHRREGSEERRTGVSNPRLQQRFERYGVPGVSMGSQVILPSQITATTLIRMGAPPRQVIIWQSLSITAWGLLYGTLAALGITALI